MSEIIVSEKYGKLGSEIRYVRSKDKNRIARLSAGKNVSESIIQNLNNIFREAFLPQGYPDSVSNDYVDYQIWDTVQAFCSTIMGTLTTQAILKGLGVGDAAATPYAAAIAWILKDGTGMIGRIVFAWWKGVSLDMDCKKWRLFADILNDAAMLIELTLPYFAHMSTILLCATTSMKALVGVAGGATRASITQHQAIRGNMADVSAKDGSQETFVNLCSSFMGIFILTVFDDPTFHWLFFIVLMCVHLFANYSAVNCLVLHTLNNARLILIVNQHLGLNKTEIKPERINKRESVFLGFGVSAKYCYGFNIKLGCSLRELSKSKQFYELQELTHLYQNNKYLIVPDVLKKTVYVAFEEGETAVDVISAYYQSILIGFSIFDRSFYKPRIEIKSNIVKSDLSKGNSNALYTSIAEDADRFVSALKENGWSLTNHLISVDEWRAKWKKTI